MGFTCPASRPLVPRRQGPNGHFKTISQKHQRVCGVFQDSVGGRGRWFGLRMLLRPEASTAGLGFPRVMHEDGRRLSQKHLP